MTRLTGRLISTLPARVRMVTKTMPHTLTCSGHLAHDVLRAPRALSRDLLRPYLHTMTRQTAPPRTGQRHDATAAAAAKTHEHDYSVASAGGQNHHVDQVDGCRRGTRARSTCSRQTMRYLCSRLAHAPRAHRRAHRERRTSERDASRPVARAPHTSRRGMDAREATSRPARARTHLRRHGPRRDVPPRLAALRPWNACSAAPRRLTKTSERGIPRALRA